MALTIAWILGSIGFVVAIMGVLAATEVVPFLQDLPAAFTPMLWLAMAVVLILAGILCAVSRTEYE